jgi:hypothetical protein
MTESGREHPVPRAGGERSGDAEIQELRKALEEIDQIAAGRRAGALGTIQAITSHILGARHHDAADRLRRPRDPARGRD